ncbi:MAG: hypothetical protein V1792_14520 [Pseudomonadota bacterium]
MVVKSFWPGVARYEKFFVFMGVDQDRDTAYGFFINSDPITLAYRNPSIMDLQVEIPAMTYAYLFKPTPSYVNSFEYYDIPSGNLLEAIVSTPSRICDPAHLLPVHLDKVLAAVNRSPFLSADQKDICLTPHSLAGLV